MRECMLLCSVDDIWRVDRLLICLYAWKSFVERIALFAGFDGRRIVGLDHVFGVLACRVFVCSRKRIAVL